jgi:hypothetical protein
MYGTEYYCYLLLMKYLCAPVNRKVDSQANEVAEFYINPFIAKSRYFKFVRSV